jgi:hypothetical protein
MRYVALSRPPRAWLLWDDTPVQQPSCTVWEAEREPVDTGLVDPSGIRLYRVEDREPIGFRVARKP